MNGSFLLTKTREGQQCPVQPRYWPRSSWQLRLKTSRSDLEFCFLLELQVGRWGSSVSPSRLAQNSSFQRTPHLPWMSPTIVALCQSDMEISPFTVIFFPESITWGLRVSRFYWGYKTWNAFTSLQGLAPGLPLCFLHFLIPSSPLLYFIWQSSLALLPSWLWG